MAKVKTKQSISNIPKYILFLVFFAVIIFFILNVSKSDDENNISTSPKNFVRNTQECLIGFDWCFPSCSNPTLAWKFSGDGTFNFSTKAFGGMSAWGNWHEESQGKIRVSYTRTTENVVPQDQLIIMSSCNMLRVGSTVYYKGN